MSMKLYILGLSPHSRKTMALAAYLNIPLKIVIPEFPSFTKDPNFLKLNPNGKVPVLENGDTHIWESNTILRYLAEKADSNLWPKDSTSQLTVTQWQFWEAFHFSPALLGVYFERFLKGALNMGEPDQTIVEEKLGFSNRFLNVLDGELAKRDFVAGKELSIADFSVGAIAETTKLSEIDLSGFKNVGAWLERLRALKGWEESLPSPETALPLAG